jgi:hypothetical protein
MVGGGALGGTWYGTEVSWERKGNEGREWTGDTNIQEINTGAGGVVGDDGLRGGRG